MTREEVIARIKNYKDKNGEYYKAINGKKLENVPFKQAFAMLMRLEKQPIVKVGKVRDVQLELNFN